MDLLLNNPGSLKKRNERQLCQNIDFAAAVPEFLEAVSRNAFLQQRYNLAVQENEEVVEGVLEW